MKLLHAILGITTVLLLASASLAQQVTASDVLPPAPEGKAWKMIWNDEFSGTTLDTSKWGYGKEGKRLDGWWKNDAISLDGHGCLVIKIYKEDDKYISGGIESRGKFEHTFGYYVARVKFPTQNGHWPAFWMRCQNVVNVAKDGRAGTELDIMEKPWLSDKFQHALHWSGYKKEGQSVEFRTTWPGVSEGFHTFAMLWLPEEYVFYVDGNETWRTKAGGVSQVPEYILFSDEIWKLPGWTGDIKEADLPDAYLVDYVRVYDLVKK